MGTAALLGTIGATKVSNLKGAASALAYEVGAFELHKIDPQAKTIEVKLQASFNNPTNTPISLSNLLVRLHIPGPNDTWLRLAESRPTGSFTIVPGPSSQPLKFTAPIAQEFFTIIPNLLQGNSLRLMIEVFPQFAGRNLEPVQVVEDFALGPALSNLLKSRLGLGYVALDKKAKKDGKDLEHVFPGDAVIGDTITVANGSVFRTLAEMEKVVKATLPQTKALAKELKKGNLKDTVKAVFDFANDYFSYKMDDAGVEQIRTPARAIKDRFTGIDCDCFTVLISSILYNLGIKHSYRMVKYDLSESYSHVYVVVPKKQRWKG